MSMTKAVRPELFAFGSPTPLEGFEDKSNKPLACLEGLSRVNVLVGANNSGKSRLLRALARLADPEVEFRADEFRRGEKALRELISAAVQTLATQGVKAVLRQGGTQLRVDAELFQQLCANRGPLSKNPVEKAIQAFQSASDLTVNQITGLELIPGRSNSNQLVVQALTQLRLGQRASADRDLLSARAKWTELAKPRKSIYIPILRGLRPLHPGDASDHYADRTYASYFGNNKNGPPEVFTGLKMNVQLRKMKLGNHGERRKVEQYEEFLANEFFGGKRVELTPSESDVEPIRVKIGHEAERPIFEQGDGLQTVFIITFPMFTSPASFFFIEEPDQCLHPGLQRLLLETMQRRSEHYYFLTTHSNHFLDMALDFDLMSIFHVEKLSPTDGTEDAKPPAQVIQVERGDQSVLAALGVRNSSVFLVNATIWVEGVTDRLYFRRYLDLFQVKARVEAKDRIQEDVHFSFVEYGGANITHWSFLEGEPPTIEVETLCSKAMLIADSDSPDAKTARKARLDQKLGDRFILLPVKEVENLLPARVISAVVGEYGDAVVPSALGDYSAKNLGAVIESELGATKKRKASYQDGNTISDKLLFCKRAIVALTGEDLSPPIEAVCKRIVNFIRGQNGIPLLP